MADRQRRDHAQEAIDVKVLNDQEEADVDIQYAEFLAWTVSADAYAEKIDLKPRTVSFQGGEDDTTMRNLNSEIDAVSTGADMERCISKYPQLSFEYEQPLVDRCMHAEALQAMCIRREEKPIQVKMIIASVLDSHASRGNEGKEYFSYFGKLRSGGGTKESNVRIKRRRILFFLFLPIKEAMYVRRPFIWEFLSLKDIGWGPPRLTQRMHKPAHARKLVLVLFCFNLSSRFRYAYVLPSVLST